MINPIPKQRALAAATIALYLERATKDYWDDTIIPGAALELAEEVEKILAPKIDLGVRAVAAGRREGGDEGQDAPHPRPEA